MLEDKPEDAKVMKEKYDEVSKIFDESEDTFEGILYKELEWERLVKRYLPKDKKAKILDAGGGTGRLTLPMAELGYRVTLCDLSPGMLSIAEKKLQKDGLLERVEIKEADLASLPFPNEVFNLVISFHGAFSQADSLRAAKEFSRVLKRGGKIIVDADGRYCAVARELGKNPERALKLLKGVVNRTYDVHGDWGRVFSPEELKELFEENSIRVIQIYGHFHQLITQEVMQKREWEDKFLAQAVEAMLCLRDEPSVIGMARELVLVGEKI
jgi:ubiquinone/menaquinone biosynthesis C-methylase UbiE